MELYVHIPFCVKKCAYCDFLSFPKGEEIQRRYVEKLMEEIRTVSAGFHDTPVSSVFVGGGTPSVLKARWMKELFDCLRASFHIEETAEISMEANPGERKENHSRHIFLHRTECVHIVPSLLRPPNLPPALMSCRIFLYAPRASFLRASMRGTFTESPLSTTKRLRSTFTEGRWRRNARSSRPMRWNLSGGWIWRGPARQQKHRRTASVYRKESCCS